MSGIVIAIVYLTVFTSIMLCFIFIRKHNMSYAIVNEKEIKKLNKQELSRNKFYELDYALLKSKIKKSLAEQIGNAEEQKMSGFEPVFKYDDWTERLIYCNDLWPYRNYISKNIINLMSNKKLEYEKRFKMFLGEESFIMEDIIKTYIKAIDELREIYDFDVEFGDKLVFKKRDA